MNQEQKNLHGSASPLRWLAPAEVEDFIEYLVIVPFENQDDGIDWYIVSPNW